MKVSFDFDDTLSTPRIQDCAEYLIGIGAEVHIVTARPHESMVKFGGKDWNDDLYAIADYLGIKRENIHFMNLTPKYKFFKENPYDWHIDDDLEEWQEINRHTNTKCYKLYEQFFDFLDDIQSIK